MKTRKELVIMLIVVSFLFAVLVKLALQHASSQKETNETNHAEPAAKSNSNESIFVADAEGTMDGVHYKFRRKLNRRILLIVSEPNVRTIEIWKYGDGIVCVGSDERDTYSIKMPDGEAITYARDSIGIGNQWSRDIMRIDKAFKEATVFLRLWVQKIEAKHGIKPEPAAPGEPNDANVK